jgi:hypothetical protein
MEEDRLVGPCPGDSASLEGGRLVSEDNGKRKRG